MLTTLILAEEAKPGLLDFNPASAIWVLCIFLVLVIVLYKTAWKNVLAGLEARENRIRKDIADAEAARVKAENSLKQYQNELATAEAKVRDIIAKGTADAEKLASNVKIHAQEEAEATKEKALKDIETARANAVRDVYQQGANLAVQVAEKIIRRNLNPDDQRDLVEQSLEQLQGAVK
jgi:F-type H+-transporting ATPase subunit b